MSPCQTINLGVDGIVIICSRGQGAKPCVKCGREADRLCDFPLSVKKHGQTCNRPVCSRCSERVGPNRDYCPAHATLEPKP
jgi:hypothetical protein